MLKNIMSEKYSHIVIDTTSIYEANVKTITNTRYSLKSKKIITIV